MAVPATGAGQAGDAAHPAAAASRAAGLPDEVATSASCAPVIPADPYKLCTASLDICDGVYPARLLSLLRNLAGRNQLAFTLRGHSRCERSVRRSKFPLTAKQWLSCQELFLFHDKQ